MFDKEKRQVIPIEQLENNCFQMKLRPKDYGGDISGPKWVACEAR